MPILLPALAIVLAVAGLLGNMYAEGEPGGVPLLVLALSLAWYFVARFRVRSGQSRPHQAGE